MDKIKLAGLKKDPVMVKRAELVRQLLETIPGEDVTRESLEETPWRVAKMFDELYWGYGVDPKKVLQEAMFEDVPGDDLVVMCDLPLFSTCAHHTLPFIGTAHIAYIPKNGKVVGISKLPRVLEIFARRLQEQENIGHQVAQIIDEVLEPLGVAVIITASHTCATARGIRAIGSSTTTTALRGIFKLDEKARTELYNAISINRR